MSLAFWFAAILWGPVLARHAQLLGQGEDSYAVFFEAFVDCLTSQQGSIALSKRLKQEVREIWFLQVRLTKNMGKNAARVYAHPKFRVGYDFLLLRARSGEQAAHKPAQWWQAYVSGNETTRLALCQTVKKRQKPRRKKSPRLQFPKSV